MSRPPLRAALVLAFLFVCSQPGYAAQQGEKEVRRALASFLDAFNNLDWATFHVWIAADATLFNPEIPEAADLGRIDGKEAIERSFRSVFEATKRSASGPPYLHIMPKKIQIQMLERAAIVTFEFERGGGSIGRRTLVFRRQAEGWRIIHIHASNTSAAVKMPAQ